MNEAAIGRRQAYAQQAEQVIPARRRKAASTLQWYTLLAALIVLGWLLRDYGLVSPEQGVGYWLGIVGGSLMLILLLYPMRKRIRALNVLGPTKHWFRLHMILGLAGPLLIIYHCNYRLGSFNSRVALYCMLLVAGSGIIGRHFYAGIHRGLYGRRTNLQELQAELASSIEKSHGLARLMPKLVARLEKHAAELLGNRVTQSVGLGRSLRWTFTHHFVRLSLWLTARRELRAAAAASEAVARDQARLRRASAKYIRDYTFLTGRVAQFSLYERLFALWHVFHLPIFLMMVISAIVHVLAVHMY
jgi:hypothetical protein